MPTALQQIDYSNPNFPYLAQMELRLVAIVALSILWSSQSAFGIRFVIDRQECFSHPAPYEGDTVSVSFVVIKFDQSWHRGEDGVDLVVRHHIPFESIILYMHPSATI